ncbi:MAG: hypothetical protein PHZ00_03385 [Candidatus Peribacteraceae bacterium]|nr:hypothetical protein [Candidatus Peribacteraceae bacterium]
MLKKSFIAMAILSAGIVIGTFGIGAGFGNIDCGCGCCGGTTLALKRMRPRLFIVDTLSQDTGDQSYAGSCISAGCSLPVFPIYVDLYALSLALIIASPFCSHRVPRLV